MSLYENQVTQNYLFLFKSLLLRRLLGSVLHGLNIYQAR
jgi:hypothetical protein